MLSNLSGVVIVNRSRVIAVLALAALGVGAFGATAQAQTAASAPDAKFFSQMQWRSIGPMRGGRMRALDGVASQPNVFYAGADNGEIGRASCRERVKYLCADAINTNVMIEVKTVNKSFGETHVLHDFSAKFEEGQVH